jgi:lipopolysaccharide export system permease protein
MDAIVVCWRKDLRDSSVFISSCYGTSHACRPARGARGHLLSVARDHSTALTTTDKLRITAGCSFCNCQPGKNLALTGKLHLTERWTIASSSRTMPVRMRLLDRYCLRELSIPLAYCLSGFLVFWISFDLLNDLDEFQRAHLRVPDIAQYYLVRLPELLVTVLPISLLLALLYVLGNHARHNELTAMRAAGMSLWRICTPYLVVGAVCGVIIFVLNEIVVPDAAEAANAILTKYNPKTAGDLGPDWQLGLAFHNEKDNRIWNVSAYNKRTGQMRHVAVEWRLPDGTRRRYAAESAIYTNGFWVFNGLKELHYPPEGGLPSYRGETNEMAIPDFKETPEQINSEIKFAALNEARAIKRPRLSLREILDYQRLHPTLNPRDKARLQTQFHGRLAEPVKCLVVVLIAAAFGASGARRSVLVGVAGSIFITFAYFIIWSFSFALGTGQYLPPAVAAWAPNALFALSAIIFIHRSA